MIKHNLSEITTTLNKIYGVMSNKVSINTEDFHTPDGLALFYLTVTSLTDDKCFIRFSGYNGKNKDIRNLLNKLFPDQNHQVVFDFVDENKGLCTLSYNLNYNEDYITLFCEELNAEICLTSTWIKSWDIAKRKELEESTNPNAKKLLGLFSKIYGMLN